METKEGTMTLPMDEPDGKDSGEELAIEVDEEALQGVPMLREMLTARTRWLKNAKTTTKPYGPQTQGILVHAHN